MIGPISSGAKKFTSGFRKYVICCSRPASLQRGASRSSRTLGGCGGRDAVVHCWDRRVKQFVSGRHMRDERQCCGRQRRVVLTPRRWCQVSLEVARSPTGQRCAIIHGATVVRKPGHRGERVITRKTIAWECRMIPVPPL